MKGALKKKEDKQMAIYCEQELWSLGEMAKLVKRSFIQTPIQLRK